VDALYPEIFVSRAERGRVRGEAHAATIRSIGDDGSVVYERKAVDALGENDLDRIKDAERNHRVVSALRAWIAAGKPNDKPPLSPKGDPIRKVSLATNKKVDVLIRDGAADRGEMVRVDVFRKRNRKGTYEYFLVPIYPHQVADKEHWPTPPDRAIQAKAEEANWSEIGSEHEFMFSVFQRSFIRMVNAKRETFEGYLIKVNRNDGGITLMAHNNKTNETPKTGSRTLHSLQKFSVDRLGRRNEIQRETRTWRGVACT
jgi:CRISPR-associated endonuclease Csn1